MRHIGEDATKCVAPVLNFLAETLRATYATAWTPVLVSELDDTCPRRCDPAEVSSRESEESGISDGESKYSQNSVLLITNRITDDVARRVPSERAARLQGPRLCRGRGGEARDGRWCASGEGDAARW